MGARLTPEMFDAHSRSDPATHHRGHAPAVHGIRAFHLGEIQQSGCDIDVEDDVRQTDLPERSGPRIKKEKRHTQALIVGCPFPSEFFSPYCVP